MPQLLAWFAGYLVASLIARLFVGVTFVYVSTTLISSLVDAITSFLSQYTFYQILLLAGIGKVISILSAAFIFKASFLYFARKSS